MSCLFMVNNNEYNSQKLAKSVKIQQKYCSFTNSLLIIIKGLVNSLYTYKHIDTFEHTRIVKIYDSEYAKKIIGN